MTHKDEALSHIRDALYALGDYYNDAVVHDNIDEITDIRKDLFVVESRVKSLAERP